MITFVIFRYLLELDVIVIVFFIVFSTLIIIITSFNIGRYYYYKINKNLACVFSAAFHPQNFSRTCNNNSYLCARLLCGSSVWPVNSLFCRTHHKCVRQALPVGLASSRSILLLLWCPDRQSQLHLYCFRHCRLFYHCPHLPQDFQILQCLKYKRDIRPQRQPTKKGKSLIV